MPTEIATFLLAGTAASATTISIVTAVVSVGLSYVSKSLFTPSGQEEENIDQGILANTVSNSAPVPVIYGYRKVGGSKVYQAVTNENQTFWTVLVIGEGEIESIEKIFIDDDELVLSGNSPNTLLTTTSSLDGVSTDTIEGGKKYRITALVSHNWGVIGGNESGQNGPNNSGAQVGDVFTATLSVNAGELSGLYGTVVEVRSRYTGKCEFFYRTGTNNQLPVTAADFGGTDAYFPTNWDEDKRLFGLAYVMCKFTYDRDVFRGIPNVTMEVKGIKVPDVLGTITNKKWDRNPAAAMYDYLTNPVYGRGLEAELMDISSFREAYTYCETALEIQTEVPETAITNGRKYRILTVANTNWSSVGGPASAVVGDVFIATSTLNVNLSANLGTVVYLSLEGAPPPKSLEGMLGAAEQKIYRIDGVLNVNNNTFENTKKILSTCRSFLIFSAGKYKILVDKFENEYSRYTISGSPQVPSITPFLFNEDNMIGGLDITLGDKTNTYNRARYSFFNPQGNWMYDTAHFDDSTVRTNSDRGLVLEQNVRMEFVASRYCAQGIIRQNLRQSRQQIIVGFNSNISALANDVGDIVDISNENAGWVNKQFRILRLELKEEGSVTVSAVEYHPGVYNPDAAGLVFARDALDTNLPNPFAVSGPPSIPTIVNANLSGRNEVGLPIPVGRVKAFWPKVLDPFVDFYELQYAVTDQLGSSTTAVLPSKIYSILTTAHGNWSTIGGPSSAKAGDMFIGIDTFPDISFYGTVAESTEDPDGYSTVNVPFTQFDVSSNLVEYIENLSPTTGYAFRVRYVRTNSVHSPYSLVRYFATSGLSQFSGSSYVSILEATAGNPNMLNNVGTVTYTAFLLKGGTKSPNLGVAGSEINSYDWYYAPSGGSLTQITNSNKAAVTGSTANNALGGSGTNFNSPTLAVEADGTALGISTSGNATFSCNIDYTET